MSGIGDSPFHVKGIAYRNAMAHMDEVVPGGSAAVLRAIDDDALRAFASQVFVAGGWYDVLPFVAIDTAAARLIGLPLHTFVRGASEAQAQRELSGLYRTFIKLLGASTVASVLPRLAAQYYDFGTVAVEVESRTEVTVSYGKIPELLRDWLPTVGTAYLGVALELAGMRDVRWTALGIEPDGDRGGHPLVRTRMRGRWSRT